MLVHPLLVVVWVIRPSDEVPDPRLRLLTLCRFRQHYEGRMVRYVKRLSGQKELRFQRGRLLGGHGIADLGE